jgi:hypothetical protein
VVSGRYCGSMPALFMTVDAPDGQLPSVTTTLPLTVSP